MRIGEGCSIITSINNIGSEPWLVELGNNITITGGVVFITHDGSSRLFRKKIEIMNPEFGNRFGTIRIKDNSFIGINAILTLDIEIGPYAIVGAGSIVTDDVPPYSVYAGNPARFICTYQEYIDKFKDRMLIVKSEDRISLRKELTNYFRKEER